MKKLVALAVAVFTVVAFSGVASAGNAVSQMATNKGGQHIAQCAQMHEQGISMMARMPECSK